MRYRDKHKTVFTLVWKNDNCVIEHMCVCRNIPNMAWDIVA